MGEYHKATDRLSHKFDLTPYPCLDELEGLRYHNETFETSLDYTTRATLVLVELTAEVERMSRPEIERALIYGALTAIEVYPDPRNLDRYLVTVTDANTRTATTAHYQPDPDHLPHLLAHAVNVDAVDEWAVTHYDQTAIVDLDLSPLTSLYLFDGDGHTRPDKVRRALNEFGETTTDYKTV